MQTNNIRTYAFQKTDRLFFDANIWITIYNPFDYKRGEKTRVYSNAYHEIINQGIKIHVDALILSEVINRMTRFRYDFWKSENPDQGECKYKQYRATDDYRKSIEIIESTVKAILTDCLLVNTNLSRYDLFHLLVELKNCRLDFNDLLIVEICKENHYTLVTDDADYQGTPIPILTYNRALLG